ncbi:ATP-dependent helicase/nuclease subunit B [Elusimicrobium posterum]|uniref:PD-(D/E)XK nuclease family protein n=1 Tax=Elusimicrobium posterum TaxID=3116653 RepID=UPI003C74CECB
MKLTYSNFITLQKYLPLYIGGLKQSPLDKLLVVTPSGRLARHLQAALTRGLGHTSNITFSKLSALAPFVIRELNPSAPPPLGDNALQDFILKNLISKTEFKHNIKRGYIPALKSTLRDLADAMIDPQVIGEHAAEGAFGNKEENEYMVWLTHLYTSYQNALSSVPGYRSYTDYYREVIESIKDSSYLKSFKHIIFYGFYDFTGTQLEIFNAIKDNFETTLFFPYQKTPAYKFASKLFETNILGMASSIEELPAVNDNVLGGGIENIFSPLSAAAAVTKKNKKISLFTASGAKDEVSRAAKEILDLVENKGFAFSDIALCARAADSYKDFIFDVFEQNKIPLNTVLNFPLLSRPLAAFCLTLLNLARNGFYREDVLSIVTSPYFNIANSWAGVVEKSLAQRDYSQWIDLVKNNSDAASSFLAWLEKIKLALEGLNAAASWEDLAARAAAVLETYVNTSVFDAQEAALYNDILSIIKNTSKYSLVRPAAQEQEFLEELYNLFYDTNLPEARAAELGVTFDNIMNLRGRDFKAVIILGVNEKILPQIIREDPVLRDNLRRILRDVQGFYIGQKLDRFEEEKIFFYLAVEAAKERLVISFQRSDEDGKPQTPSLYLSELCRAAGLSLEKDVQRVGRRELEKCFETPEVLLSKKEMSLKISSLADPLGEYERAGFNAAEAKKSFDAARMISSRGDLNNYDGTVSFGEDIYSSAAAKGFSATALQTLAQCPLRYFLRKGVGLDEEKEVYKRDEFASNLKGTKYHKILQILYNSAKQAQNVDILLQKLEEVMSKELTEVSYKEYGIYPVIWQVIIAKMKNNLREFVKQDFESMDGFYPAFFEHPASAEHEFGPKKVKLYGEIDRIDTDVKSYRVTDYKSAQKSAKDLTDVVFKKQYFQPVIYLILAGNIKELQGLAPEGFSFLNIDGGFFRRSLTTAGFDFIQERFSVLINLILDIVKQGKFFINDGDHCQYCSYSRVCRKGAGASLVRARNSAYAKELEGIKNV